MAPDKPPNSTDADESTATPPRSRRELLKLAGTAGAASLGAASFVETAAASESSPDPAAAEGAEEASITAAEKNSIDAAGVDCLRKTGTPGVTIDAQCANYAYDHSWSYARYILDQFPALDACRTQAGIAAEIEAHQRWQHGESITLGCGGGD